MFDVHNACMPSVTIRDVPESVHAELAAQAARSGRSLQEYLRRELMEMADRVDPSALMDAIRDRKRTTGAQLSAEEILRFRDVERR